MDISYNQIKRGIKMNSIDTAEEKHTTLEGNDKKESKEKNSKQIENNETNEFISAQKGQRKYTSMSDDISCIAQSRHSSDNLLLNSALNIDADKKQFKGNATSKDSVNNLKLDYSLKSKIIGRNETISKTTGFISVKNEHGLDVDSRVQGGSDEEYVKSIKGSQRSSFNKGKNIFSESSLVSIKNECLLTKDSSESSPNIVISKEITGKRIDGPISPDGASGVNTNDAITENVMKTGYTLGSSKSVAVCQSDMNKKLLEGKIFSCPFCPEKFARIYDFDIHYRTHWEKKPFICNTCKKKFTRKENLESHYRTHTGGKPFVCDVCKNEFTRKDNLEKHYRTHSCEKQFVCDICEKGFTTQGDLSIHARTHTVE